MNNQPRSSFKVVYFYILVGVLLFLFVDHRKVEEHAFPKTLSRLRVNYSFLIDAAAGNKPGLPQLIDGRRYFKAVISIYGPRSDAQAFLAMTQFYLGDRKASKDLFVKVKDKEAGFFWAYYDLALLAFMDKDFAAAEQLARNALELPVDKSVSYMISSKVYQPLFIENGIAPQQLAQNIDRAKLILFKVLLAIRSGSSSQLTDGLLISVF